MTYGKVEHITRESKKDIQKLSLSQVKNIDKYIEKQSGLWAEGDWANQSCLSGNMQLHFSIKKTIEVWARA